MIQLLTTEIEKIKEKYKGNIFIKKLLQQYNYSRNLEEEEIDETFGVESFNLLCY